MPQTSREIGIRVALGVGLALGSAWAGKSAVAQGMTPPAEPAVDTTTPWGRSSRTGSIGLFGTSSAEVGPLHQLRLGFYSEYFSASDFLIAGDSEQRLRGGLVVGFTPHKQLEIFGAVLNASNRNTRTRNPADQDPELIKSFGDLVLGAKGIYPLSPAATVGVELGFKLLAGVSELSLAPGATSFWLGPVFSYDVRQSPLAWPLRLHAAASFYADNSSGVHDLSKVTRNTREVAMFGYGIAPSRLRLALAADAPLPAGKAGPIPLDPFIEYHVEYVTAGADAAFSDYTGPACGVTAGAQGCVDNRDAHWVTLGVRGAVYRQLTVDLGVDLRIRSPGFPYGVPVPPFNLVVGVSLPIDVDLLTGARVATKIVERPAPPTEGYVTGQVLSLSGATPVSGAIVAIVDRAHARVATDADGGFTTLNLPPGPVELEVSAANFEPLKVVTTVVAGRAENVVVTMRPKAPSATVHGRVSGRDGQGLDATVKFSGRAPTDGNFEARTDASGAYALTLPTGAYRVRTEARSMPAREAEVQLATGDDRALDFLLRPAPSSPNVLLAGESIRTKQAIRFVGASATLQPASEKTLDAVAELLEAHVEIKRVQIVGHWDNGPPKEGADALTRTQAEAVKAYLVARGISDARLAATGAGASKPLVPNLTPANRTRNRRVEFHLE